MFDTNGDLVINIDDGWDQGHIAMLGMMCGVDVTDGMSACEAH
jgi:hypothetical protein